MGTPGPVIERLAPGDGAGFEAMLDLFGAVFEEPDTYGAARPGAAYRDRLLADPGFVALVARIEGEVAGALVAYELRKFERERSEFHVYDLAVAAPHRRQGIATALIGRVVEIAREAGGWVVFVQADAEDAPAIAVYERLGTREKVVHFDIPVGMPDGGGER